jgi:hypothetical protein
VVYSVMILFKSFHRGVLMYISVMRSQRVIEHQGNVICYRALRSAL